MFTGIVEEVGRIARVERRGEIVTVEIAAERTLADLPIGGSIAVSGCCLTAVRLLGGAFVCELTPETLARTSFGPQVAEGRLVNLERPMPASGRFDGHIVQGHVDGVGRVRALRRLDLSAELVVEPPAALLRFLVEKGSVTVDGVSLTVASLQDDAFTVALIPFTLDRTTLGGVRPGDPVNLEADVIAKYVLRLMEARGQA